VTDGDLRAEYRRQILNGIGGWSGMVVTALPTVAFIIVNVLVGLGPAIGAAIGVALLCAGYRLLRHQPVQQALTGLFGVAAAALIAAWTGQARGYFLWGIWSSFAYAAVFGVSVLVRRPLVGVAWEFLEPTPGLADGAGWRRVRRLVLAYDVATVAATVVFVARAVVQLALFNRNATGWLAFARIAMGYPLTLAAIGLAFWVVRRARRRVAAEMPDGPDPAASAGAPAGQAAQTD
jgi:hypothetical protein